MVDIGAGLNQPSDNIRMSSLRAPDKTSATEAVEGSDVCTVLKREFEQLSVALAGGDQVCTLLSRVFVVDISTGFDESLRTCHIVLPSSVN